MSQAEKDAAINVVDFGADPTGVRDSTQAIQNAIDFAAHLVLLKEVAPATMPANRRIIYQAYEDAWRATQGLPTVAVVQEQNKERWLWLTVIFSVLALVATIAWLRPRGRRKRNGR
jgi:hypothetical protein